MRSRLAAIVSALFAAPLALALLLLPATLTLSVTPAQAQTLLLRMLASPRSYSMPYSRRRSCDNLSRPGH